MDKETADRLFDVVLARAGLKGKPGDKWTEEDSRRFQVEMDRMPGVFRDYATWLRDTTDPHNTELAESYGMSVETFLRASFAGNDTFMRRTGHPESDPPEGHMPNIPGNTFGVGVLSTEITVS